MTYRLGIDVGGTNTDAVILDESRQVVAKVKQPTTSDVMTGIYRAIEKLLAQAPVDRGSIRYAMLGTTQCTNAIVERKQLNRVGIIRIGAPATTAVPPLAGWDDTLRQVIGEHIHVLSGGYEYSGKTIAPFDEEGLKQAVREMRGKVQSIAVIGVFSPVRVEQERQAAHIIREIAPEMHVSLSHEIGSIGLVERENATILNAALMNVIQGVVDGFNGALQKHRIGAELYLGQNDGTLMSSQYALQYPIFTIACGPTNSIRGAMHLSGLKDAIIVDIGGTTTDVGVVQKGFPRQSALAVDVGGVRTNFRMPDILSIGLGGGTVIHEKGSELTIGPESVGYLLPERGQAFGGPVLTATDVAICLGLADIPGTDPTRVRLSSAYAQRAHQLMVEKVAGAIDRMKTSPDAVPVVLVGGGSVLMTEQLPGASEVIRPPHSDSANAIGAALGDISGDVEKVYSLSEMSYDEALADAKQTAIREAVHAGADPDTVQIMTIEDVPLAYMPGNATLIKVKAAGEIKK
ncbi:MAG: hydantoinase/oxoprolinase family protein [Novibacillus thermophilus]